MAVKIRLRRMGQKKAPFIELSLLIPAQNVMENVSRRSAPTIRPKIPAFTK